jgi:hypothetical protein
VVQRMDIGGGVEHGVRRFAAFRFLSERIDSSGNQRQG